MNDVKATKKTLKTELATLKTELDKADLSLKRIESWAQLVAMVVGIATLLGTCVGAYVAFTQRTLLKSQALEATEKESVSFRFRLTPVLLPDRKSFYVKAAMRNLSVRNLNVLMIGIRAWQGDKWEYDRSVKDHQGELIVSDSLVSDMGNGWKAPSQPNLKLHEFAEPISLEATEQDSEETFGPYPIDEAQIQRGFWLMGRLYVTETKTGSCGIDTGREPTQGTLPFVCELDANGKPNCEHTNCSSAIAAATYYSAKKTEGFVSSELKQ